MSSPDAPATGDEHAAEDAPATGRQALVAALQWGLVQAFVLDTLGRFLRNYYRATTDAFFPPSWVTTIQFAVPLGLLVGGVGGYRWVTSGSGATTASAHRNRVVFVGSLLAGWALAAVPTLVFDWLLGDRLFTVPYFVLPTLVAVLVVVGATLLAYRVDATWYRRRRNRLLGAVQGAASGLVLALVGFGVYSAYLFATRTSYSLDGGPGTVVAGCLGAVAGYVFTDTDRGGDRAAEFLTLLVPCVLGLAVATTVGSLALGTVGVSVWGLAPLLYFPLALLVALSVAGVLTYGVGTSVYRRLVS